MPINFFAPTCQEPSINAVRFGICDDQQGGKAYTNTADQDAWVATVENDRQEDITFTAIDQCIEIYRANGDMENRCDGMLTYPDNIVFVELKDQRGGWIPHATLQLETTIRHFQANHDLGVFRHKRAFACNKRHPRFQVINASLKQEFFHRYGVRLNVGGKIKI